MRISQSISRRGKKDDDIGRIKNAWTLRLTHTDEQDQGTNKTWQYSTKQEAKDDVEPRKDELLSRVESKGRDPDDIETFQQWAEFAKRELLQTGDDQRRTKSCGCQIV